MLGLFLFQMRENPTPIGLSPKWEFLAYIIVKANASPLLLLWAPNSAHGLLALHLLY